MPEKHLHRSYDVFGQAGSPYALLASAIIFQAAADCDNWSAEAEDFKYYGDKIRKDELLLFIESEWLDELLSWQKSIKADAVRAELLRRLS